MNNLILAPIIIPLIAGVSMFFYRDGIRAQKWVAVIGLLAAIAGSVYIVSEVAANGIMVLHVGGWDAPFGISLVADMMAALLVLTSSVVSLACLLYAFRSLDAQRERFYVYPVIMILICGVNGSFITGDIFNLFVFFEVMLIASYVLVSIGSEKVQLREAIKYLVINIVSSMLFIVAIANLYAVTGTLNMAHLSERVAMAGQDGLMTTIALIFLVVFGLKAGLFLFYWLPGSYSAPPAAIIALFAALLTKVGIYAIIRIFTLIFYHNQDITHTVMLGMGAVTMLLGAFGAVAFWQIKKILTYNVIVSVGFIIFGVAVASQSSLTGALYYLIHDMVAKGLIFILGGAIIAIAGTDKLHDISGLIRFRPLLGWLFLLAALAIAGVPPLSGFVGKLLILQGGVEDGQYVLAVVGLLTSLLVMYSLIKIFIHSFWGEELLSEGEEKSSGKGALLSGSVLAALVVFMGVGSEWALGYIDQAVGVLLDPSVYINAVLYSD